MKRKVARKRTETNSDRMRNLEKTLNDEDVNKKEAIEVLSKLQLVELKQDFKNYLDETNKAQVNVLYKNLS